MNQGNNNNGKMVLFVYCLCFLLLFLCFVSGCFSPSENRSMR
jgi:hypothetical protein